MTLSEKRRLLVKQLEDNIKSLDRSRESLRYSYEKCQKIGFEKAYFNVEEQEAFEALAGRFARTSDLLTQKVFKTIFSLLQEDIKTFIDGANFLEKLEIIQNADDILNIRELRNQIAHEYIEEDLNELFKDILKNTVLLEDIMKSVKDYSKRFQEEI